MARKHSSQNFTGTADTPKSPRRSTPEGAERSSDNSRTHGCTSRKTLLPGESPAELERLWKTWLTRYQAQDEFDLNRIEDAVNAEWRKRRSERVLNELEAKLHAEQPDSTRWTPEQNKQLQLFRRYYTADSNYFQKTLKLIESLKKSERNTTLTNHRIAEQILHDVRQPRATQVRMRTALDALYEFPFPKPDTASSCACPPCTAFHVLEHWHTKAKLEMDAQFEKQSQEEKRSEE